MLFQPRGYGAGDIQYLLARQGYQVAYIDRRGGAFFVRVYYGPEIYEGLIGCDDGRWIRRQRVGYVRGYNGRDYDGRGGRDHDRRGGRW